MVIEVLRTTKDDRIASCKVHGVFDDEKKAKEIRYVCSRSDKVIIIVPNISMEDIPSIVVSDWCTCQTFP